MSGIGGASFLARHELPGGEAPATSCPDPLDAFEAFAAEVRKRLDAGRVAYGDRSFDAAPAALVGELEAEALELSGWGFVLWVRLRRLRQAAERIEGSNHGR